MQTNKIVTLEASQNEVTDRLAQLKTQCVALAADNVKLRAAVEHTCEEGSKLTAFMGPFLK